MKKQKYTLNRLLKTTLALSIATLSSCAMSQDRAGQAGGLVGGGGGLLYALTKSKGDITSSTVGDAVLLTAGGYAAGDAVGRQTSTMKDQKKTEVPNQ